jgi:hypothetical protein
MILDSSMGNLIRKPEPTPSERQNACGEDSEGKIILDSGGGIYKMEPVNGIDRGNGAPCEG